MSDAAPRLYLITPLLDEAEAFAPRLKAALDAGDVACLLLRIADQARGDAKTIIRALTPLAQQRGVACLIEDDTQLAARADTDGVHIEADPETHKDVLDAAIAAMQPRRIVGVGGLMNRDAAMIAGESGADYLMFGLPDVEEKQEDLLERIAWWAEIFQVPCVGQAHRLEDVPALVQAGADFIALGRIVWEDPRGPAAVIAEAMEKCTSSPMPAR
ncbi:thiamine phosphate synthase [Beijerinckia indica]|uniref:Thiamine monophosphate synthase n=1 Tax=Beijerinckia indica subsp. indica (strain ATCC 9039 / DSM 1715 / NCIMB 8712) TaxID=395963 RepID=B2IFI3_BEII9|nr:thiamine phosphate synthase [Beijerinckia indica]ACB97079.1 thiamine monophosphate synthase [Beijerinckia indica subsp. indica ATCC 9039]